MLLQRLVEYAEQHGETKPFHQERQFSWQLNLDRDGRAISDELQELVLVDAKGRAHPLMRSAPYAQRSGTLPPPQLAADDAIYVLGWTEEGKNPQEAERRHEAFVDLIRRWAQSEAGECDNAAQAVWQFYRSGGAAQIRRPPKGNARQGVIIAVDGTQTINAPSVVPFWNSEVARRKGGNETGLCLVCGKVRPLLKTVPGMIPGRLVPGATQSAALVSVNEEVFGYGLAKQLGSTPLCLVCSQAMTAALVDVLSPRNAVSHGGKDSRLAWWVTGGADADDVDLLDEPDSERITALLRSVHSGRKPGPNNQAEMFCSLTVGGNVARVMVRDWVQLPLPQLKRNIARWFTEHQIATRWDGGRHHHGIGRFALVTGRWLRDRQRYADFDAKGADRPDSVHRDLVRAAIRGTPLPPSLLAHVVHRIRTDGRLDEPRAALIRLALIRSPLTRETPMPDLDPTNTDPGYVAGRLFAALEQLQYDASDSRLNTTYGDRFFAGAVTNPRAAIVNGRRDANAWLRKLRRSKTKPGAAIRHDKRLDELFRLLDVGVGLPARTTLYQQSMFLLGYHHQRAHHFASLPAATAPKETSQ